MRRTLPDKREPGGDQRFLTFLLLSVSILMFSQLIWGPGPQPPAPPAEQAEGDAEPGDEEADAVANADEPAAGDDKAPQQDAPAIEATPEAKPQLVAIGSGEVDGPYRMLLTLDNRGAAIKRAELSAHEFCELDHRSGYLGELELTETDDGLRVGVVGAGTPAAAAGIEAGDVLTTATVGDAAQELTTIAAWRDWLATTKPKQEITLRLRRDGAEQSLTATLTRMPLAVLRPESENVRLHTPKIADDVKDVPSFVVRIDELNKLDAEDEKIISANERLATEAWEVVEADEQSATFRLRLADLGVEFEKRFALVEVPEDERDDPAFPGYHFEMDVRVKNLLPTPQSVAYTIDGPNGLPIEGWWYANRIGRKSNGAGSWGAVGIRDVIARYQDSHFIQYRCSDIVDGDTEPMGQGASMAYLGVDAQYFSVVMMPKKKDLSDAWFDTAEARLATPELPDEGPNKSLPTYNNTTFTATRKVVDLAPAGGAGDTLDDGFRVFAGPKRPELLAEYDPAGDDTYSLYYTLYYGWFGFVARPMLSLLHAFYSIVGNYGIAIVMLTICVRGAMFPLSRKQAMNMAKMQELKPEMDRITEKYKDDMEKRTKAQQELYRKHNFNPMGGCLLMFIQLPIFIGLYRALAVDLELRQAPLFGESIRFCGNLAAPDAFFDWSGVMPQWFNNGQGIFALGPYFNILPIITIVLFLLQQKMFMPPPANEQAELQQKMMKYMMVVFGIMFFKVPSGLCLYFIASSIWGITERMMLPKPEPPADQGFSKPSPTPKPKPSGKAEAEAKRRKKQAANKKKKR